MWLKKCLMRLGIGKIKCIKNLKNCKLIIQCLYTYLHHTKRICYLISNYFQEHDLKKNMPNSSNIQI